jgi:hypothetical protein
MPGLLTPAGAESGARAVKSTLLRWWLVPIPLLFIALIGQIDKMAIQVVMANRPFLADLHLVGRPAVTGLFMTCRPTGRHSPIVLNAAPSFSRKGS